MKSDCSEVGTDLYLVPFLSVILIALESVARQENCVKADYLTYIIVFIHKILL